MVVNFADRLAGSLDGHGRRIDQVTPTYGKRDAISDEALLIRDGLRSAGFASTIFSPMIAAETSSDAEPLSRSKLAAADLIICHFAIASDTADIVLGIKSRRALWYHNIAPGSLYRAYSPATADLLDAGRAQLRRIASRYDLLIADSLYNAAELSEFCTKPASVVAFPVDYRRFDTTPVLPDVRPARVRWLTVGRVAPGKGLLRAVRAFAAFAADQPDAQYVIAGAFRASDPFFLRLDFEVRRLGLRGNVAFVGSVSNAELLALYTESDVYVALSEHEGFCVPLVEAMHFDLPVVASTAAAIPETLGEAGMMVEAEASPADIAALVDTLIEVESVRDRVLAAQRIRRTAFDPPVIFSQFKRALDRAFVERSDVTAEHLRRR